MNKKIFSFLVKGTVIAILISSFIIIYATKLTDADKREFIEVEEIVGDGETVNKKIPAIEDPCGAKSDAVGLAKAFVKQYNIKAQKNNYLYKEATTILKEIKARKFDEIEHLSRVIELSLPNWACTNNYKLHNVENGTPYFFRKSNGVGIFISMRSEGNFYSEGVRQGLAGLPLDMRGPMGDTYYLYVVITDLNPKNNEKISSVQDKKAKEILNNIVENAYKWGNDYYSTIIK